MDTQLTFSALSTAFGGVGVFLLGMRMMSDGLQAIAGRRLAKILAAATGNRISAVLAGVAVTCLVQSSTATTVMVVGFVNSGLLTLVQGIGVVFGANVGTTLTLWILTLDVSRFGALATGVAVFFYLFARSEKVRWGGMAALGLGMLFFGLRLLTDGLAPLRGSAEIARALSFFRASSTAGFFGAAAAGAAATFVLHSSAGFVAVVMGLAGSGALDFPTAVAVVLGSNVGTTGTALVSCAGASRNALRAALAHVLFNLSGLLLVSLFWRSFAGWCQAFADRARGVRLADLEAAGDPRALTAYYTFAIACVHTFFNVAATAALVPFIGAFAKFVRLIVPVRPSESAQGGWRPAYLVPHVSGQPAIALEAARKEILRMGETCLSMMAALRECLRAPKPLPEREEEVFTGEDHMDTAQKEITEYVEGAMRGPSTGYLAELARREIRQADEFESVSDYVRNALKSLKKIRDAGESLTPTAVEECTDLCDRVSAFAREVMAMVASDDASAASAAEARSREIDDAAKRHRAAHMSRIGITCKTPVKTLVYSDLLVAFRRQNDHLLNIAQTLEG